MTSSPRATGSLAQWIVATVLTALVSGAVVAAIVVLDELESPELTQPSKASDASKPSEPSISPISPNVAEPPTSVERRTVIVRVETPSFGCWRGTIGSQQRQACRPVAIPVGARLGYPLRVYVDPEEPVAKPVVILFELDGRVVQTVGPTTGQYPFIDFVFDPAWYEPAGS